MNFVLLAVSALATPATASTGDVVRPDVVVQIADLDLGSEAGLVALDRRIEAAARRACGLAHPLDAKANNDVAQCRSDALRRAHAWRTAAAH